MLQSIVGKQLHILAWTLGPNDKLGHCKGKYNWLLDLRETWGLLKNKLLLVMTLLHQRGASHAQDQGSWEDRHIADNNNVRMLMNDHSNVGFLC